MKPGLSPADKFSKDLRVLRLKLFSSLASFINCLCFLVKALFDLSSSYGLLRLTLEPLRSMRGPMDSLNGAESSCWSASGRGGLKTVTADYDRFCAGLSRSAGFKGIYIGFRRERPLLACWTTAAGGSRDGRCLSASAASSSTSCASLAR